jgi:para-nitrobenzyl esterase
MTDPIVDVAQGKLKGVKQGRLLVFRGVRYAQAERFQPPQRFPAWSGVRAATEPGPICPQHPNRLEFLMGSPIRRREQSEACQVLSIFSPSLSGKRPVMVWIHGGAYVAGGGEEAWYDAFRLADEGDMVTITITYRLGAFGYLHTNESGALNVGLQDQLAALKWIRENIAMFGGDPDGVTVFGQSAGAHSIAAMLAVNGDNLFSRAILQSMPGAVITEGEGRERRTCMSAALGKPLNVASSDEILEAQKTIISGANGSMSFGPIGVDILRPANLHRSKPLDVLITWTRDDAAPFVAMRHAERKFGGIIDRIFTSFATRGVFSKPSKALGARLRNAGHRVSTCEIRWRPQGSPYGAAHCVDLPLLLGSTEDWTGAPMLGSAPTEQVERYGKEARSLWAEFARSGQPPRQTEWLQIV